MRICFAGVNPKMPRLRAGSAGRPRTRTSCPGPRVTTSPGWWRGRSAPMSPPWWKGDKVWHGGLLTAGGYGGICGGGAKTAGPGLDEVSLKQGSCRWRGLTAWQGCSGHRSPGGRSAGCRSWPGPVVWATWRCSLPQPGGTRSGESTASPDNHSFPRAQGQPDGGLPRRRPARPRSQPEGGPVDLVLDPVGGESGKAALACVRPGGRLVTVPPSRPSWIKAGGGRGRGAFGHAGCTPIKQAAGPRC